MLSRRALLLAAGALALPRSAFAGKPAAPPPIPPLPLIFAVAEENGAPVRDARWVDEQIAQALALFEPLGIPLRKIASGPLAAEHAHLETREDRDALAARLEPHRINVFIVASLRDVDDPKLMRMGVHWRNRTKPARHYIVVAGSARPSTLAHELGHYFGLDHSSVVDNIMSYDRSGGAVFFDEKQAQRMREKARVYVAGKMLEPASAPGGAS